MKKTDLLNTLSAVITAAITASGGTPRAATELQILGYLEDLSRDAGTHGAGWAEEFNAWCEATMYSKISPVTRLVNKIRK